jgi:hypothetical protein
LRVFRTARKSHRLALVYPAKPFAPDIEFDVMMSGHTTSGTAKAGVFPANAISVYRDRSLGWSGTMGAILGRRVELRYGNGDEPSIRRPQFMGPTRASRCCASVVPTVQVPPMLSVVCDY